MIVVADTSPWNYLLLVLFRTLEVLERGSGLGLTHFRQALSRLEQNQ
jgi:hypothetical protein